MKTARPLLFHTIRTLSLVVALAGGLTLAGAMAADQGPRHHAEGQYEAAAARYVVTAGDDLTAIAERFGIPMAELKSQNKLASNTIEAGQKPVSYTHLDVYKRQPLDRPARRRRGKNLPFWQAAGEHPGPGVLQRSDAGRRSRLEPAPAGATPVSEVIFW